MAAFRVLDKLADAHHTDTDSAYRNVESVAVELGCSRRTVQRAFRDLEVAGLIHRGDQRLLGHLRADRRPTVYRLAFARHARGPAPVELDGVTTDDTPSGPVDNPPRGDRHAVHGVTTVVALGTQEHRTKEPRPATDRACAVSGGAHEWSKRYGVCGYCGARQW